MLPPMFRGVMFAPANQAAFNDLFVGKRAATNFPTVYADFVSPGRFRETQGADTYTGSYTYQNTGSNTGTVTFNYDDGGSLYDPPYLRFGNGGHGNLHVQRRTERSIQLAPRGDSRVRCSGFGDSDSFGKR